jgi:hypothetical protein
VLPAGRPWWKSGGGPCAAPHGGRAATQGVLEFAGDGPEPERAPDRYLRERKEDTNLAWQVRPPGTFPAAPKTSTLAP